MLYQAIQAKSQELEKSWFDNRLKPEEAIKFLDALVDAIPYVADTVNYGRALVQYRKWKTILLQDFDEFYDKRVRFNLAPIQDSMDKFTLEQLTHFVLINKVNNPPKAREAIRTFSAQLKPFGYYEFDLGSFFDGNTRARLIKAMGADAEYAYRVSDFEEAKRIYSEFIDYVNERISDDKQDTVDLYFLAWALHGLGNVEYSCQHYKKAHQYYVHAYKVKDLLKTTEIDGDVLEMGRYSSEIKIIATSLAFPNVNVYEYISKLQEFYERLEEKRDAFLNLNETWFDSLETYTNYLIGKGHAYVNDRKTARKHFRISIDMARKIGDGAAEVRGVVFAYSYRVGLKRIRLEEAITESLHSQNDGWVENPNIKRLQTGALPLELRVQSKKRATAVYNALSKGGVSPLPTMAT